MTLKFGEMVLGKNLDKTSWYTATGWRRAPPTTKMLVYIGEQGAESSDMRFSNKHVWLVEEPAFTRQLEEFKKLPRKGKKDILRFFRKDAFIAPVGAGVFYQTIKTVEKGIVGLL